MYDIVYGSDVSLVRSLAQDEFVVQAARVSTQTEDNKDNVAGLINYLVKHKHGSPFEHNSFTFKVTTPIFVAREFMRHRIGFSYNEVSGRYSVLESQFYVPSGSRPLRQVGKPGAYEFEDGDPAQFDAVCTALMLTAENAVRTYHAMLDMGIAKEVARMVLPVNTMTSFYVTCNARSLMSFLNLRTHPTSKPQYEIEDVARQMEVLFAEKMPLTHEAFIKNGRVAP